MCLTFRLQWFGVLERRVKPYVIPVKCFIFNKEGALIQLYCNTNTTHNAVFFLGTLVLLKITISFPKSIE